MNNKAFIVVRFQLSFFQAINDSGAIMPGCIDKLKEIGSLEDAKKLISDEISKPSNDTYAIIRDDKFVYVKKNDYCLEN